MRLLAALALAASVARAQDGGTPEDEFAPLPASAVAPRPADAKAHALPKPQPRELQNSGPQKPASSAESPDEAWGSFPGQSEASPPAQPEPESQAIRVPALPTPPPPPSPTSPGPFAVQRVFRKPRPEDFNNVSVFGAPALGSWKRAVGGYLGFPLLGVRLGAGVTERLDLQVAFDSFYGVANALGPQLKWQFLGGEGWAIAAVAKADRTWFTQRSCAEGKGPRWLTGDRNWNAQGGMVVSYRGDTPRSARLFFDGRYHVGFDTEPCQRTPLGGVPADLQIGHNLKVRMGAEMPFSPRTSFLFILGFDVHGRADDSPFMPVCAVGLVTAL